MKGSLESIEKTREELGGFLHKRKEILCLWRKIRDNQRNFSIEAEFTTPIEKPRQEMGDFLHERKRISHL